jgi:hypothetical protein
LAVHGHLDRVVEVLIVNLEFMGAETYQMRMAVLKNSVDVARVLIDGASHCNDGVGY